MRGVKPLPKPRPVPILPKASARPVQRERDERAVLEESLSEQISVETLLDTDAALSYRAQGIGPDTLRKLRRGFWAVQGELDLHGHRVPQAQQALAAFLRDAAQRGSRCVRIVHGKGNGSPDGVPVLKDKVRAWLTRRSEVLAFCQARPADGGGGALLVLLKPSLRTSV